MQRLFRRTTTTVAVPGTWAFLSVLRYRYRRRSGNQFLHVLCISASTWA